MTGRKCCKVVGAPLNHPFGSSWDLLISTVGTSDDDERCVYLNLNAESYSILISSVERCTHTHRTLTINVDRNVDV